jgi:primosomal protein N' (replication factor Y)
VCSSADHELAENQAKQIKRDILDISGPYGLEVKVLGPTPAPIAKIKTLWRWHLLVKAKSAAHLNRIIRELAPQRSQSKKVRIVFDMDPQDLM